MQAKTAAFLLKDATNIWECTRSAVGLAVENIIVGLFFIDVDLSAQAGQTDFLDLLEMIDDLDGHVCTTGVDQPGAIPFLQQCGLTDIRDRLPEYDIVICFRGPRHGHSSHFTEPRPTTRCDPSGRPTGPPTVLRK